VIDTIPRPDAGLPQFLAARARHASDTRLAADAIGGMFVAVSAAVLQFPAWYLVTAPALCFLAFGIWGIADRELGERGESASRALRLSLRAAQMLATLVGTLAFASVLLMLMAIALGRIIS
jgi:hypothetical protein